MKLLLLIVGLTFVSGNELWDHFKITYGKSYANIDDELYRKSIFEENQKYVEEHNQLYLQGLVTFDLKMNTYGDLTSKEFAALLIQSNVVERPVNKVMPDFPEKERAAEVDWREKGAVTPVKDQGMLGASWAFSATGSLESIWFLKTGDLIPESQQQLADCVSQPPTAGWVQDAYAYIKENGGIDSNGAYQYKEGECNFNPEGVCATVTGYVDIPEGNEETQAKAVHDVGPVSVLFDAGHITFQLYSSGIYYEPDCDAFSLNHCLVAVGYGSEDGNDYWILKNTWGTGWGEAGYVRTARNKDNNCGVASISCYPTV